MPACRGRDNQVMTDGMRKAAEAGRERASAAREAVGGRIDAAREATGERVDAAKAAAGERVEAAKTAAVELQQKVKPKLRGVIHEYSFPVSKFGRCLSHD